MLDEKTILNQLPVIINFIAPPSRVNTDLLPVQGNPAGS